MNISKNISSLVFLFLLATVWVYAAAPSGGYLPWSTTNPDCAPWDADCFVQLPYISVEGDPIFSASPSFSIGTGNIWNWNTAFWWWNHAIQGYLTGGSLITSITSLNTLTWSTQNFAVGTSGTGFNIQSTGSTHTFNIPDASTTARGFINTLAQSFDGLKTFLWDIVMNGNVVLGDTLSDVITINGNLQILGGSIGSGKVLMSDASGNASWQNLIISDNQTLALSGNILSISNGNALTLPYLSAETDPIFTSSPSFGIGTGSISNWNTAFWWGDHATAWYLTGTKITSINGLTGVNQLFAIGNSGTGFTIISSGNTHTFNLPNATSVITWLLSNTDWNTFNNKLGSISIDTANRGLTVSWSTLSLGLASSSATGALSSTDWNIFNNKIGLTSLSGVSPIAYNNTNGQISFSGSTSNITEGTNLYWTQARFDTAFSGKTTSNLSEGTNLYFTNARGIGSNLTWFTAGSGTVTATDTILQAIQKLQGSNTVQDTNIASKVGLTSFSASGPLSYNSGSGLFSISQANTSTNGFLSNTDWNTFNNKLGFTSLSALGPVTYNSWSGIFGINIANSTTTGAITPNDWNTFNNKQNAMSQATTSSSGWLSSTDWNTFNNKIGFTSLSATGGISYNNGSWLFNDTFVFTGGLTRIGNTISAWTMSSYIPWRVVFWSSTWSLTQSSNLFWDTTNSRLGIGTSTPYSKLATTSTNIVASSWGTSVNGISWLQSNPSDTGFTLAIENAWTGTSAAWILSKITSTASTTPIFEWVSNWVTRFLVSWNGNVGIGTTNPNTRLEVRWINVTAPNSTGSTTNAIFRMRGDTNHSLDFGTLSNSPYGSWIQSVDHINLSNSLPLVFNPNGGNVGIGDTTPSNKLEITHWTAWNSGLRFTNLLSTDTWAVNNGKQLSVNANGDVILMNEWAGWVQRITLTADGLPNNSTVYQTATWLTIPVTSGLRYHFECTILYNAATAATGSRWSLNGPTFSLLWYNVRFPASTTTDTVRTHIAYDVGATTTNSAGTTGNIAQIKGVVKPTANGNLNVRFASEDTTAITPKEGSACEYWSF
jgi:hypothetical protein